MKQPWIFVVVSFLVGLLSLSEEIVWVRLVSLLLHSIPQAFSYVLLCFIAGIALGSLVAAKRAATRHEPERVLVVLLTISGLSVISMPWILLTLRAHLNLGVLGLLILVTAAFKGAIFPLVHHYFSRRGESLGRTLSFVYVANVMGSTLGPLLTGFILLDHFSAYSVLFALGMAELFLALALWSSGSVVWRLAVLAGLGLIGAYGLISSREVMPRIIEAQYSPDMKLTHLIENRHGVIHTMYAPEKRAELVFGGNVYDGAVNIDLRNQVNGLERLYLLAALQPSPKQIAVIGLSVGSWLYILRAFPDVEQIDVVEINPGYVELSKHYPGYADYLSDPRVRLHFMDGRQWLRGSNVKDRKFDLIVMNTTWHWRIYASNLLSQEFLGVINKHLAPGGVATFNATGSLDAFYTASKVFPKAWHYGNFIYGSPVDVRARIADGMKSVCRIDFKLLGLPDCSDASMSASFKDMLAHPMRSWREYVAQEALLYSPEAITDDNMLTEYRRGKQLGK